MKFYGYKTDNWIKFEITSEELCYHINTDTFFDDNTFIYTTEQDRDFHYNENKSDYSTWQTLQTREVQ